jgi:anion-transporting  ArsA/GET3 family ATPase
MTIRDLETDQLPVAIPNCQILIVTGKGGVGKSAVATALAKQSALEGKRTLLTVYEREDTVHPLLDASVAFDINQVDDNLWVSRLDSRLSMKEYIHRTVPFHHLYDWIMDGKVLAQFTDAAPGFDELMCLGKLYDLSEGSNGKATFDRIVFDAPATGHCALMLRTPAVTAEAVGSGPMHKSAVLVKNMLTDKHKCCVLVVALPEEMAILEGQELHRYISDDLNLHVGPMIINRVRRTPFSEREIDQLKEAEALSIQAKSIVDNAIKHHEMSTLQNRYITELKLDLASVLSVPQVVQKHCNAPQLVAEMASSLAPALRGGV